MTTPFVHLRVHSEFSLVDGLVRIKPYIQRLTELKMPAAAITDESNLFALVKFQKSAVSAGIKPIYGADIWVSVPWCEVPVRMTALIKHYQGYLNLTRLLSDGYRYHQPVDKPIIPWAELLKFKEGLIFLSGGHNGVVGSQVLGQQAGAKAAMQALLSALPNHFYLEVQRLGRPEDEPYLRQVVALATEWQCPVVATNTVCFLEPSAFEAHEVRVCIHQGETLENPKRPRLYTDQQYLKSPTEMAELFADLPEAIENTHHIAMRCSAEVPLGTYYLPNYPIPDGHTIESYLVHLAEVGLKERIAFLQMQNSELDVAAYQARLKVELDIINQMGFPGYFLIVMDFIQWAKDNQIPVGPGRGSGAGSLVAYALKITDLDPLTYDLLFERFLNPERVSMPDFDIDFCMEGRDRVIEYVAETYGRDAVSQIITYGSMAAKAVVRDVGRVLGKPYGFVDRIAKLVPFELGMTLTKALEHEAQLKALYDDDDEVHDILDRALELEGLTRNVGKHAGGVVIAPGALTDLVPLYCDNQGENLVTQFDKDDVEQAGLVKFDFLGLRTLTIIDWALKNIVKNGRDPVSIESIPLDDKPTFSLLESGVTTAVFQLESRGMKELIKRLKPSSFEDIVALVALFRPGPLQSGMVDDFINRKHGRAEVTYPHPWLEPILENTYGVILYQEQVMQIAQVLAGYTLGQADMLRRAMGKKKPEEMAKQRELFLSGSGKLEIEADTANYIFDLMEKFAGYGFNKSHSAAYALLSYQTAWLKTHYPSEFMAAVLSSDMDNTDKVVVLVEECRDIGLEVSSPRLNESLYAFSVKGERIIYGLGAIKGVGESAIESVVKERLQKGEYTSLFNFVSRVDLRKLNRRTLEAMCRAGALDELGPDRATIFENFGGALDWAEQQSRRKANGLMDLFADIDSLEPELVAATSWTDKERLQGEKQTLGLYLTGHPIDEYEAELRQWVSNTINRLEPTGRGQSRTIAGLVLGVRTMKSKRGGRNAFVTLDDRTGRIEVSVFGEVFERCQSVLIKDEIILVEGEISNDEYSDSLKIKANNLISYADAQTHFARALRLQVCGDQAANVQFVDCLVQALEPYRGDGKCPVLIDYQHKQARVSLQLSEHWKIQPKSELRNHLLDQPGIESVQWVY